MYISVTYYKSKLISEIIHIDISRPNKYRLTAVLYKRGNTQSESFGLQYWNIEDLNDKYHGFNWNPQISQYQEVKSAWKYYGNPINPQGFQSKILQILQIIWNRSKL